MLATGTIDYHFTKYEKLQKNMPYNYDYGLRVVRGLIDESSTTHVHV